MFSKILFAHDGGMLAERALIYLEHVARVEEAEVIVRDKSAFAARVRIARTLFRDRGLRGVTHPVRGCSPGSQAHCVEPQDLQERWVCNPSRASGY